MPWQWHHKGHPDTHTSIYFQNIHKDTIIDDKTKKNFLYYLTPNQDDFTPHLKFTQGKSRTTHVSSNPRFSVVCYLWPIVHNTPYFIKNATHYLDAYPVTPSLSRLTFPRFILTSPHNEGVNARRCFLNTRDRSTPTYARNSLRSHQDDSYQEHFQLQ